MIKAEHVERMKDLLEQVKSKNLVRYVYYDDYDDCYCVIGLMASNAGVSNDILKRAMSFDIQIAEDFEPLAPNEIKNVFKIAKRIKDYYGIDVQTMYELQRINDEKRKEELIEALSEQIKSMEESLTAMHISRLEDLVKGMRQYKFGSVQYYDEDTDRYCPLGLMALNAGVSNKTLLDADGLDIAFADEGMEEALTEEECHGIEATQKIGRAIMEYYGLDIATLCSIQRIYHRAKWFAKLLILVTLKRKISQMRKGVI